MFGMDLKTGLLTLLGAAAVLWCSCEAAGRWGRSTGPDALEEEL